MSPDVTPLPPPPDDPVAAKPKRENPKALWAMILGFVSLPVTCLCGFGLLLGIPAVIWAGSRRTSPPGRWLAIGGIVCGAFSITLGTLWLVLLATGAVHPPST